MAKYREQGVIPKPEKGKHLFVIRYEGPGGSRFKTWLNAVNKKAVRKYFDKYFPMADVVSVSNGPY